MYSKLGVKITNDQFDIRIKDFKFKRIDDYINANTSIKFECKICGKVFKKKPKEINKLKCNCLDRGASYKRDIEGKNLILLDVFYNFRKKIRHKCLSCNNEFLSSPKVVKSSIYGCPFCAGTKISIIDYNKKMPKEIEVIGEYVNSYTKIKHRCRICNNCWITKPNYILHMNCGCPFCSSSKGEKLISDILNDLDISFKKEYLIKINNKSYYYDFFIPDLNLAIEYDGVQHFEAIEYFGGDDNLKTNKINDNLKNKWSLDNNIKIIRIPYYFTNEEIEIKIVTDIYKSLNDQQ